MDKCPPPLLPPAPRLPPFCENIYDQVPVDHCPDAALSVIRLVDSLCFQPYGHLGPLGLGLKHFHVPPCQRRGPIKSMSVPQSTGGQRSLQFFLWGGLLQAEGSGLAVFETHEQWHIHDMTCFAVRYSMRGPRVAGPV